MLLLSIYECLFSSSSSSSYTFQSSSFNHYHHHHHHHHCGCFWLVSFGIHHLKKTRRKKRMKKRLNGPVDNVDVEGAMNFSIHFILISTSSFSFHFISFVQQQQKKLPKMNVRSLSLSLFAFSQWRCM